MQGCRNGFGEGFGVDERDKPRGERGVDSVQSQEKTGGRIIASWFIWRNVDELGQDLL